MKIEKAFRPVTITIETQKELEAIVFAAYIGWGNVHEQDKGMLLKSLYEQLEKLVDKAKF